MQSLPCPSSTPCGRIYTVLAFVGASRHCGQGCEAVTGSKSWRGRRRIIVVTAHARLCGAVVCARTHTVTRRIDFGHWRRTKDQNSVMSRTMHIKHGMWTAMEMLGFIPHKVPPALLSFCRASMRAGTTTAVRCGGRREARSRKMHREPSVSPPYSLVSQNPPARSSHVAQPTDRRSWQEGMAGEYPCKNVDLLSFLSLRVRPSIQSARPRHASLML